MEEKKRGRPCKYLQIKTWNQWLENDWQHLCGKVKWIMWLVMAVLGFVALLSVASIALLVIIIQWFYKI